jgi:hypothetical protein
MTMAATTIPAMASGVLIPPDSDRLDELGAGVGFDWSAVAGLTGSAAGVGGWIGSAGATGS